MGVRQSVHSSDCRNTRQSSNSTYQEQQQQRVYNSGQQQQQGTGSGRRQAAANGRPPATNTTNMATQNAKSTNVTGRGRQRTSITEPSLASGKSGPGVGPAQATPSIAIPSSSGAGDATGSGPIPAAPPFSVPSSPTGPGDGATLPSAGSAPAEPVTRPSPSKCSTDSKTVPADPVYGQQLSSESIQSSASETFTTSSSSSLASGSDRPVGSANSGHPVPLQHGIGGPAATAFEDCSILLLSRPVIVAPGAGVASGSVGHSQSSAFSSPSVDAVAAAASPSSSGGPSRILQRLVAGLNSSGSASPSTAGHNNINKQQPERTITTGDGDSAAGSQSPSASSLLTSMQLLQHLLFSGNNTAFNCPICKKCVQTDDIEMHIVLCLSSAKPLIQYNVDLLNENKGECVICLDNMENGSQIARLPCLCIYHKSCIDRWLVRKNTCPQHPEYDDDDDKFPSTHANIYDTGNI